MARQIKEGLDYFPLNVDIDQDDKKISLSMKALLEPEVEETETEKVQYEEADEEVYEQKEETPKAEKAKKVEKVVNKEESESSDNFNTALGDLLGNLKLDD